MLVESADVTVRGEVDILKRREAVHRDQDSLEDEANRNLMKFKTFEKN